MNALIEGFAAGRFDSLQPVIPHASQDLDHPLADRRMEHSPLGCRSPSSLPLSLRRIAAIACGSTQSRNGAPFVARQRFACKP
jgi:hypothetical protein